MVALQYLLLFAAVFALTLRAFEVRINHRIDFGWLGIALLVLSFIIGFPGV